MNKKKWTIVGGIAVGLVVLLVIAVAIANHFSHSQSKNDSHYQTAKISADSLSLSGKVVAQNTYLAHPDGQVKNLPVKTGDHVNQNDLLVTTQDDAGTHDTKAPFEGTVVVRYDDGASTPTIELSSVNHNINTQVSEYDHDKLHVGDTVKITTVAGDQNIEAKVTTIAQDPSGDGKGTSQYPVTIDIGNQLMNGQSVKINAANPQIKVPAKAIVDGNKVFVVKDGKAKKVDLEGQLQGDVYLVTKGLSVDDQIVTNPDSKLQDGTKVEA
ncbi:hypothetical protein OZX65_01100 [Leuconostocaceae bacterium ESL0723]|nr:hypothetical protein OZX65_01100 [Leuconostocaceae bacterium ESL0723]